MYRMTTTNPQKLEKAEEFKDTDQRVGSGSENFTNICKSWTAAQWAAARATLGSIRGHFGNNVEPGDIWREDTASVLIPCHPHTVGMECH